MRSCAFDYFSVAITLSVYDDRCSKICQGHACQARADHRTLFGLRETATGPSLAPGNR
jgi:hypothetical protein